MSGMISITYTKVEDVRIVNEKNIQNKSCFQYINIGTYKKSFVFIVIFISRERL